MRDFPDGPSGYEPTLQHSESRVRSLVGELRSHMPWSNSARVPPLLKPRPRLERACATKTSMTQPKTYINMPFKSKRKTSTEIDLFLRHISQTIPKSTGLSSSQELRFHHLPGSPDSSQSYMTSPERCFAGYTERTEGCCPRIVIQRMDLSEVWGHAGKPGAGGPEASGQRPCPPASAPPLQRRW